MVNVRGRDGHDSKARGTAVTEESDSACSDLDDTDLAELTFDPIRLTEIDYGSPELAKRLLMANVAISWLHRTKAELGTDMEMMLVAEEGFEIGTSMAEAEEYFRELSNIIRAALARSAISAASMLVKAP